jgi:hypothetical protein
MVMIMGEVLQMKVVAAAQSAGVPFFEEHGSGQSVQWRKGSFLHSALPALC